MYSVYADGVCIYNDIYSNADFVNGISPKLEMSDNTAGSFTIILYPGNPGYDSVERLATEIVVKREDDEIWAGRVISEETDFYNSRTLTCEGELAYLNDTTQPPTEYSEMSVYDFLCAIITIHNNKVGIDKQFGRITDEGLDIGAVTVEGDVTFTTDDETTLDVINEQLIENFGGHMRVRREYDEDGNLVRYLDYLADYPNTNAQTIRFGHNLLDFTKNWDMSDLATVVVARGEQDDDGTYLDVSEENGGSRYVTNEEGIKAYGWIEVVVDWEDVTDASELLELAEAYLEEEQFDEMTIEISAVDLRYLSEDYNSINLLDQVRVISTPHGMNKVFPVTELGIQLDNPENSTYVLGDKVDDSFTSSSRKANEDILNRVNSNTVDEDSILEKAYTNATEIMNLATQGYVTIITNSSGSQALYVSSESATAAYNYDSDTWKSDVKLWKWNVNGLGYSKDGGITYETAITMDGAIVADFITTGHMSADRIEAGTLKSVEGNTTWDLNKGILTMTQGSINIGDVFSVNEGGYLTCTGGQIGGFTVGTITINGVDKPSIYNSLLRLNGDGLAFLSSGVAAGTYAPSSWALQPSVKGITMQLENKADFLLWTHLDSSSDSSYTAKFIYTATRLFTGDTVCPECGGVMQYDSSSNDIICQSCGYVYTGKLTSIPADRLAFGCDLDGCGWKAYDFWIDYETGGVDGGLDVNDEICFPISINSDGTVASWYKAHIRNGFVTAY